MLLPVRENLPKTRKELHPGSLRQGSGDVTQLDESIQQRPGLTKVSVKMAGYKFFFFYIESVIIASQFYQVVAFQLLREVRYLDFSQGVEELVVAIRKHVQLVARISLSLVFRLRKSGLVTWG